MARNRKYQPAAVRFGPAVKAALLCLLIGGSGVGYVWQKNQIHALGRQCLARENRLERLRQQNKVYSDILASLTSPKALEARVRELKLNLVLPQPEQIIRLVEAPAGWAAPAPSERDYAHRPAGSELAP